METAIQVFKYEGQDIEFDLSPKNSLMINATEMAKIFDKKVEAFVRNDDTKKFISECLKSENSRFLGIEKDTDLVYSKQKSGTWMHRILALKFAAWLSPAFELWVYRIIEDVLFGSYKNRIEHLKKQTVIGFQLEKLREQEEEERKQSETSKKIAQLEAEEKEVKKLLKIMDVNEVTRQIPLWGIDEQNN